MKGCIFDIQRFSIHDGPGIRTTVFLKGCPLRCRWCCNPESMSPKPVLLFNPDLCVGCGKCVDVCPTGASEGCGVDRARCTNCGRCAEVCYAEARYMKGEYKTPEEIVAEALKDKSFYDRTGGGVTFSGGEPLLQIDFLYETLSLCKSHGLSTAVETCGSVPWAHYERIAGLMDVFLFDIKSTDGERHLAFTGGRSEPIMENCARLAKIARKLIIRVPVVPEFNFDLDSLTRIVRFAEEIGVGEVNFLPYHRFAAAKYAFLGQEYWNPGVERLEEDDVRRLVEKIETRIKLQIGG